MTKVKPAGTIEVREGSLDSLIPGFENTFLGCFIISDIFKVVFS